MSFYFPRKVRNEIITVLSNDSTGLAAKIASIVISEGVNCPPPALIHYGVQKNQYPEVFVDIGNTTAFENNPIDDNDATSGVVTTYPMTIWAYFKENVAKDKVADYKEIYFEAISDLLNNNEVLQDCLVKVEQASRGVDDRGQGADEWIKIDLKVLIGEIYE